MKLSLAHRPREYNVQTATEARHCNGQPASLPSQHRTLGGLYHGGITGHLEGRRTSFSRAALT